jgi:hypothetical protein
MPTETIDPEASRGCVPNLGPKQQRVRLMVGLAGLAIALAAASALLVFEAPRWTRVALVLPLWGSAIGFFQAREKT